MHDEEKHQRMQKVRAAGLEEHYRRNGIVYAGVLCYLAGEIEWEQLLIELVQKLSVDHLRVTEELLSYQMNTPSFFRPK